MSIGTDLDSALAAIDSRLDALEAIQAGARLDELDIDLALIEERLDALEGGTPEPPAPPYSLNTLGGGIAMRGLGNVQVGGSAGSSSYSGPVHAQKFRAERSAVVDRVVWWKAATSGYGGGNGGTLEISIVADVAGVADWQGFQYASATINPTAGNNDVDVVTTFGNKTALAQGSLYWLVFRNPSPGTNFVSWDGMYPDPSPDTTYVARYHPRWANEDCDWKGGNGTAWGEVYGVANLSCFQLQYPDGHAQGNSYMEHGVSTGYANTGITSTTWVRQTFRPYESCTVTRVGVRAERSSSVGTVSALLKQGSTVLGTATFTASHFPVGSSDTQPDALWDEAAFPSPIVLSADTDYTLEFRNTSGTLYVCNYRKGSVGFDYSDRTEWPRGRAEKTTNAGASWSPIHPAGIMDLPAYLVLV